LTGVFWERFHGARPLAQGDHRYLIFRGTRATTELYMGTYVTDLRTGSTRLVSVDLDGTPVDSFLAGERRALDARGQTMVFESSEENMAPGARSERFDLYARRLR
jgi:hypothetical protein